MIQINTTLQPESLAPQLDRLWRIAGPKIKGLCQRDSPDAGTPVHTVNGRYTSQSWTEWTQGFLYGEAILQFDATGDEEALELGRRLTRDRMAPEFLYGGSMSLESVLRCLLHPAGLGFRAEGGELVVEKSD